MGRPKTDVILAGVRVLTNSDEDYIKFAIAAALRDAHTAGREEGMTTALKALGATVPAFKADG